ncbi:carbonic anhydrase [Prochlorococcus sp. MIT 1307]|uniref:carbonic anhydrase n=1 Tax=Prochlorococcus sp. MIT 1307 TaxID=3096219 RepID=UPI002A74BDEF|nr:carbonic anhydrase [Prochlorococcus sp. MIT 1307]
MSLRHPLFHRTILAIFWDTQEAGYEHPTNENIINFRDELLQELEEGILPIIERCCYRNTSIRRNEKESQIPHC